MSKVRKIIAAIAFLMLCAESQTKGWTGTLIQVIWSGFWLTVLARSIGGFRALWLLLKQ